MKKYMVMECHFSYAVVLDEEGHFLKVANRHYEVGQFVTDIIEMQIPDSVPQKKKNNKWIYFMGTMAACMVLLLTSVFQMRQMTYASVYMTINPEVRIDVNKKDIVVGLDGVNADGDTLIENYEYKKKNLELVMDELVDRAIDRGYLHEGGQISLVLDADSNEWIVAHNNTLPIQLNEYLSEKLTVTIEVKDKNEQNNQIIIPVVPNENSYNEPDYEEAVPPAQPEVNSDNESVSDDEQTEYKHSDNDISDYDDNISNSNDVDDDDFDDDNFDDDGFDDDDFDSDESDYETDDED